MPSSRQEGTCGTRETPVAAWIMDHRGSVLTADEQAANDTMMNCVSCTPLRTLEIRRQLQLPITDMAIILNMHDLVTLRSGDRKRVIL